MVFLPLEQALELGLEIGKNPNVGMTSGGVVLVAQEPFTEEVGRRFAAVVDMDGDTIYLPPFEWQKAAE
jgi:hypothetical protein